MKILTNKCNFEIVNLSITRAYCTKLYMNSVISFVTVLLIQSWINIAFVRTKPRFIYFSANQQPFISFIKIKNLIKELA